MRGVRFSLRRPRMGREVRGVVPGAQELQYRDHCSRRGKQEARRVILGFLWLVQFGVNLAPRVQSSYSESISRPRGKHGVEMGLQMVYADKNGLLLDQNI